MSANIAMHRHRSHYRPPDRVAEALARRLGLTHGSAHQVLVGSLNRRVAEVVNAHADADEFDRLERWLQPIRAALQGLSAAELTAELVLRAQKADALEEIAEVDYHTHPTSETRRVWIQRLREQQATGLALLMALLRAEHEEAA